VVSHTRRTFKVQHLVNSVPNLIQLKILICEPGGFMVSFDEKSTCENSHDIVPSDPRIFSHKGLDLPKYSNFEIVWALYIKA
jgi:hypothetical protein